MAARLRPGPEERGDPVRREIAGTTLEALRDQYRYDLFEDYLPFWEAHGIDHDLGGFMCAMDHDGSYLSTEKRVWFQGRGLWTYSFLYNEFGGDHYLDVARKAREFLVKHGRDAGGEWVTTLDREGKVAEPPGDMEYAGMFVAEGLQEYYRATGHRPSLDLAVDCVDHSLGILDDPKRDIPQFYVPRSYPGMRILGYEMLTIRVLTQLLQQISIPRFEERVAQAVDAVVNRFWNPAYRLTNEVLDHDYERPDDDNEDFIYHGHAIESSWMVLHEALRVKDRAVFDLVGERIERYLEVAWDDVYGGLFRGMRVSGTPTFDKTLWVQEEALIGTMILMEHTDLEWPAWWFDRIFRFVQETFPLKRVGYPMWAFATDRKGAIEPHTDRKENYHHPRHLMLNLLAIERMIERGGKVTEFREQAP